MESLNYLTDNALLLDTLEFAKKEKHYSVLVIRHIAEVNRRKAFTLLGYSSLFDYCVKELKFSKSGAFRRIEAAKLIKVVPEVEKKLAEGDLNLTQIGQLAPLFNEIKPNAEEKKKLVNQAQYLTSKDLEKMIDQKLLDHNPEKFGKKIERKQKEKLSVVLDEEVFEIIKEIKERKIHQGNMSEVEIIKQALKSELTKLQNKFALKKDKFKNREKVKSTSRVNEKIKTNTTDNLENTIQFPAEPHYVQGGRGYRHEHTRLSVKMGSGANFRRNIPRPIKRNVWERAGGKCEFKECKSVFGLELHHITPFSYQPEHKEENLQLLCKTHHQRQGIQMKFRF